MKKVNSSSFTAIAENNQEIEKDLDNLINQAELIDESVLSIEIERKLKNMMDFFASQVEEIPLFENLTPQQRNILSIKIKSLTKELKQKKISKSNELANSFVFTILNLLGERGKILQAEEIINQKSREGLKNFLRKAAGHEIYKINNRQDSIDMNLNFIHDAVLMGVKQAMKNIGIKVNLSNLEKSPLNILEEAHKKLQQERQL